MKRLSAKPLLAAVIGFAALAAGTAAHARSDVFFSIGFGGPVGYVQPAPVYVQPQRVYVAPQPVYVQPQPVYVQPRPVYYGHDRDRHDGYGHDRDRHDGYGHDRSQRRHGAWGDADHDGVPNRYDRAPQNPYRR
jgi:hypothetical protein